MRALKYVGIGLLGVLIMGLIESAIAARIETNWFSYAMYLVGCAAWGWYLQGRYMDKRS